MLNTLVEITVAARNERATHKAVAAAYEEIRRIEALLSRYHPESQIYTINKHAGQGAVEVDLEVARIVRRSLQYAKLTHGAFDMTIGPVVDLWGIGTEHERVPDVAELQAILKYIDYRKVEIQGEQVIRLQSSEMKLDLGGVAKGYSIDRAIEVLQRHGITSALVNAGGDISCLGTKPDGTPWRIGIKHPRESGILGIIQLKDRAVATSGDYERVFFQNHIRFHHLFDPHTGTPARGCQSVTILAETAEVADVFATAAFIMGAQRGLEFIEERPDIEGMIVRADGEILTSSGFSFSKN
jgi:thiamine biosynthesis lipoprotein